MWINRIIFKNHKVLGKMFNFFPLGNGRIRSKQNMESNIDIDLSKVKDGNFYTCIIGKNGSGKSVLLRSIIHSLNLLSVENASNPALDYFSYHSKPKGTKQGWQKYKVEPQSNAKYALQELEVIDSDEESEKKANQLSSDNDLQSTVSTAGELLEISPKLMSIVEPTLKRYISETMVIHVTNAKYDKPIRHPNPKFRSFATDEGVSNSAYLMAKSIFVDKHRDQIEKVIGNIINCPKGVILKFEVFVSYGLDIGRGIRLASELATFDFVENQGSGFFKISDEIQNTIFFADMFLTSSEDYGDVIELTRMSPILAKINEYFNGEGRSLNLNHFGSSFCFEITEKSVSNYVDLCILGIFQQLGILSLRFVINDVPFDSLSSGEKEQIRLATYLSAGIFDKAKKCPQLLLMIDEPENSLHPEWQYSYCLNLERLLGLFGYENAQVFLTTHSPLLLMGLKGAGLKYCALNADNKHKNAFDVVEDIDAYCAEEVLLDVFGVSYRKREVFNAVKKYLLENGDNAELDKNHPEQDDPINDSVTINETKSRLRKVALDILKGKL